MTEGRRWRRRASAAPLLGGCNLAVCDDRCVNGSTLGVCRRRRSARRNLVSPLLFVGESEGLESGGFSLCSVTVAVGR